ncbi:MAG: hypothetical protein M3N51_07305 [Actinomycetota bacterium]|nr:hypothetical protein [Actinomycetota bacterium]
MVERADIESKVREIEGVLEDAKESAREKSVLLAASALGAVVLSFLWGRRKGRKSAAVVEVYKVR